MNELCKHDRKEVENLLWFHKELTRQQNELISNEWRRYLRAWREEKDERVHERVY